MTATGPCLCGDPYCPSCGSADPAVLDLEEAIVDALDIKSEDEGRFLLALIPAVLAAYRKTQEETREEAERVAASELAERAFDEKAPRWLDDLPDREAL